MSPRLLSDRTAVAGQLTAADMAALATAGFRSVVNNRPDGEEPGQPTSATLEAAAVAAGLNYRHVPIRALPEGQAVQAVGEVLAGGERTLLFCRSGMRSAAAWAMAEVEAGRSTPDQVRKAAAAAGYDLSRLPF